MSHENTPSVTRRSLLRLLGLLVGICVFVGLVGIVVGGAAPTCSPWW
jgi:hypothetical protein